jgi:hypothetical protein
VQSRIIDGEQWIAKRLAFLREHLEADLTEPERTATEAEIQRLMNAPALSCIGLNGGGPLRRRLQHRPSPVQSPRSTGEKRHVPVVLCATAQSSYLTLGRLLASDGNNELNGRDRNKHDKSNRKEPTT